GNIFLYRRAAAQTLRVNVPAALVGPVAVSEDGLSVYAVVGGLLQRWAVGVNGLDEHKGRVIKAGYLGASGITALEPLNDEDLDKAGSGVQIVMPGQRLYWEKEHVVSQTEEPEQVLRNGSLYRGLTPMGRSLYVEKAAFGTRVWIKPFFGKETKLEDMGSLPFEIKAVIPATTRGIFYAVAPGGLVEWDVVNKRYRLFPVPGLDPEVSGQNPALSVDAEGRVLIATGRRLHQLELGPAREFLDSKAAELRLWSQSHPMYVKDGALRIGDFSFPIGVQAP
ncbi:MAG: hypothetical protein WC881_09145, partial [Elusimicrobiota bacterium]